MGGLHGLALVAFAVALLAALASAFGYVLQHEGMQDVDVSLRKLHEVRRLLTGTPWLAGIGMMILGQLLSAVALSLGDLALVEPAYAAMVLFALIIAAVWRRQALSAREWVGVVTMVIGIAGFVIAASPTGGHPQDVGLVPLLVAVGVILAALLLLIKGPLPFHRATGLGIAAGILFGSQDALTRRALTLLPAGPARLFTDFSPYALVAVAASAILIAQAAFKLAPLAASLPGQSILEPLCGIALGAGLFGEQLRVSFLWSAIQVLTLAAMVVGLFLVATSPLVTAQEAPDTS